MWALIVGTRVRETTDTDPKNRFHPDLQWVPCSSEVAPGWTFLAGEFLRPAALDLQDRHTTLASVLNASCERAITGGFYSAALGDPHQYSSQLDDQLNLTGAILRGLDMPYACRDEHGVKDYRLHTAAQLRQVGDDFTLYKLQLLQHTNELKQQLDLALAARDAEAMELITWEAPQP